VCLVLEILFFSTFSYLSSLDVDSWGGGEITELFTSEKQAMMMVKTLSRETKTEIEERLGRPRGADGRGSDSNSPVKLKNVFSGLRGATTRKHPA